MQPRITVITLGVDDLGRAMRFYRDGLGLPTKGIVGGAEGDLGAVAFFEMQPGLKLAVWPRQSLARDAGVAEGPKSVTEVAIAHNVEHKDEVDTLLRQVEAAGATIVKPAGDTFWGGYAGYFQDPDGHLWEVAWNPAWKPPA